MLKVTNDEFLSVIFGEDKDWCHVTAFPDDPSNITNARRAVCWGGGYYSRYVFEPNTNQYFTISTFHPDQDGKARRRKALYRQTHCLVLDDVREKLSHDEAMKLPTPTWIMETSKGSEQWGYLLKVPETQRHRIDNLNDGLIASDLAPAGKDPGQRGVTRYVRLPEGVNSKATKRDSQGRPFKCRMITWNPEITVTLDDLAAPFSIDLDVERRESAVEGAADIPDHPLLQVEDLIHVKSALSNGRFDITCPWVHEHTERSDDGAAIFTNEDGSFGFKCHHGGCENRTGGDLMRLLEREKPGFKEGYRSWHFLHTFKDLMPKPTFMFDCTPVAKVPTPPKQLPALPQVNPDKAISYGDMLSAVGKVPIGQERNKLAYQFLQTIDDLDHGTRVMYWNDLRDLMMWAKADLTTVLEQQRKVWYEQSIDSNDLEFYKEYAYVAEQNQYYSTKKRHFLTIDGFRNKFSHLDAEVHTEALIGGRVEKVDRFDYAPGMPGIFTEKGLRYVNGFKGIKTEGVVGDVRLWLAHFDILGWGKERDHILKWFAYTMRHPEVKINHALIFGGGEGIGKDYILFPLFQAMGDEHRVIDGHDLTRDFNDYLVGTKYLHINELEVSDHRDARTISNRMKPLTTAPPMTLSVNPKGVKGFQVRNIVNTTASTNGALPLIISTDTRRYFAVWSDIVMRGADRNVLPEWRTYWKDRWYWMRDCQGWRACVNYLMTQVDLSEFDPGTPPMVTDYLRDMQDASRDPLTVALTEMIQNELGIFQADILTAEDIRMALKTAVPMLGFDMPMDRIPPPATIGKVMKQDRLGKMRRVTRAKKEYRLWVIRDFEKYEDMLNPELLKIYDNQMAEIRNGGTVLKAVNN